MRNDHDPSDSDDATHSAESARDARTDPVEEASEESFPASDPPSIYQGQDWSSDAGPQRPHLDKGGFSAIWNNMSER